MAITSTGLRSAILCAGFLVCTFAAAQQVTITRDSKVMAEPNATAAVVGELKQGATAEVSSKQGAFVQVQSGGTAGWIYSFNVGVGRAGAGRGFAPAPTPQTRGASTIGIRGNNPLTEQEMKGAQFDGKQLDALDAFSGGETPPPAKKGR